MAYGITVDQSAILDGQQIDAADVNTPISNLKTAVQDLGNAVSGPEQLRLVQIATPAAPAALSDKLYFKSDDILYRQTSAGVETIVGPYTLPTQAVVINTARIALGGSVANATISSIPATYKHLLLLMELRTDVAATTDNIVVRFNADATVGNYFSQFGFVSNATLTAAENLGTVYGGCLIGSVAAGNTAPASTNGFAAIYIANYASATLQRMLSYQGGVRGAATTGTLRAASGAGWWINAAAAISSITILPNGGTNLVANSAYTLYGLN